MKLMEGGIVDNQDLHCNSALFMGKEALERVGQNENKLGSAPVGNLLFQLALPAIAAQIVNLLYNMVDRIYIGHIPETGALALTGLGISFPIIILIAAFASLFGFGGAPRASIEMGRGNQDSAEEIMGNSFCSLVFTGLLLSVIFSVFCDPLLYLFGASDSTISYASGYLHIYVLGSVFVLITTGMNAFITSQGFAKTAMFTTLIGAGLNIILDPIFIFGFGMGVKGAALATILSQAVSALWVLKFLLGKKTLLKLRKKNLRVRFSVIGPIMALGVSPFIMQSTESLISVCFNTSLLKYGGDVAVGSMTILASVMQAAMLPLQGLTQGMQPIVSFNYGAGKMERVRKAFKLTLISCLTYTTALWLAAQLKPEFFARIFSPDPELIAYSSWALRIYLGATCLFGAQIACQQTFVSLGKAVHSLFLAVLRKIILLIPLIYILPFFFEDKVFAVFLAEPIADLLAVLSTVTLFAFTVGKMFRTLKEKTV